MSQMATIDHTDREICRAISLSFQEFDQTTQLNESGSTACMCLLNPQHSLYVANAGDTRTVLVYEQSKYASLSRDHKPQRESEKQRIMQAGGEVRPTTIVQHGCILQLGPPRIWPGGLSVSRGLGDQQLKLNDKVLQQFDLYRRQSGSNIELNEKLTPEQQQLVCSLPEISVTRLDTRCRAIVTACDGIFDVMTEKDITKIIQQNLAKCQIKAIEQVAMKNINQIVEESHYGGTFGSFIRSLQRSYARMRVRIFHRLEHYILKEDLILQADFLCAQALADKLTQMALQRDTNDNVTAMVTLLRWTGAPKTIADWKKQIKVENLYEQVKRVIFRQKDPGESSAEETGDGVSFWHHDDDPSSAWL